MTTDSNVTNSSPRSHRDYYTALYQAALTISSSIELDQVLQERFRTETFNCPLRTLSDVIAEEKIEWIDFLKVDCERSELDVLAGICEDDWKKIKQVVLEIENDEMLETISAMLTSHGFTVRMEQIVNVEDPADAFTVHIYMVYAIQENHPRAVRREPDIQS